MNDGIHDKQAQIAQRNRAMLHITTQPTVILPEGSFNPRYHSIVPLGLPVGVTRRGMQIMAGHAIAGLLLAVLHVQSQSTPSR